MDEFDAKNEQPAHRLSAIKIESIVYLPHEWHFRFLSIFAVSTCDLITAKPLREEVHLSVNASAVVELNFRTSRHHLRLTEDNIERDDGFVICPVDHLPP